MSPKATLLAVFLIAVCLAWAAVYLWARWADRRDARRRAEIDRSFNAALPVHARRSFAPVDLEARF